ncbi:hypothetical protein U9M48_040641 [Paspalum notatum var. saurae]|uniref:Uncharacterized protein n=1 Tax=Paspalum notatum var. saurae TaxID=547442 RepID=A0AAQ3UM74_PASNO
MPLLSPNYLVLLLLRPRRASPPVPLPSGASSPHWIRPLPTGRTGSTAASNARATIWAAGAAAGAARARRHLSPPATPRTHPPTDTVPRPRLILSLCAEADSARGAALCALIQRWGASIPSQMMLVRSEKDLET